MPLVLVGEAAPAGLGPPGAPARDGGVALATRQLGLVAEVVADDPPQVVERRLPQRRLLVPEAVDQPLEAVARAVVLPPAAPLALAEAEVLLAERDQGAPRVLAAAV